MFRPALRLGALLVLSFVYLMAAGCAQLPAKFQYLADDGTVGKVWPPAPEIPRYRYVGQLTGESNFIQPAAGFQDAGTRFLRWVVGLGQGSHHPTVLQRPQGGVVGPDGRIYVTDVSRQAVYVFDPGQAWLGVWEWAADKVRFELPIGVATASDGGVIVADAKLGYVAHLDPSGSPVAIIGRDRLKHPTGVARDPVSGRIYVSDRADNDVKVFSDAGDWLFDFGKLGERAGEFNGPTYLTWKAGQLYVTDTLNSRIQIFSGDGEFKSTFGRRGLYVGDLPRPKGVAADRDGNVYVVESYFDYLLIFNSKGELLLPIGGTGSGVGNFYLPAGVWTDNNDRIYVADMFNGRVVIFQYLGEGDEPDAAENGGSARAKRVPGG